MVPGLVCRLLLLGLLAGVVRPQYLNTGLLDDAPPLRTRVGGQRLLTQPPAAGASDAGAQTEISVAQRAELEREKIAAQREEIVSRMASQRETANTGQPAAGWRHEGVPETAREKQQQTYEQRRKPDTAAMAAAMAGPGAGSSLADRRAAAAERLAAVRAQNADRQKSRQDPYLTPPPPPPPLPPPPPVQPPSQPSPRVVSSSGWYTVDDGGSVAFRSAPNMESRTSAIAGPNDLVYAAREPEQFPGWIQTDEGLWLPKTFLNPVAVPPSDLQMERAHAAHSAVAEAAATGHGTPGGQQQPPPPPPPPSRNLPAPPPPRRPGSRSSVGWYRVDGAGSVAFRKTPSMNDRTVAVAEANELVYMARAPPEHPGWLQTDEGLWLPAQYLVALGPNEQPTDAEADAAYDAHSLQADRAFGEGQPLPPPPPPRRLQQEELDQNQGRGGECVNSDWKCGTWAQAGECEKDSEFMSKNCRLACGMCTADTGAAGTDNANEEMERLYAAEAAKLAAAGGGNIGIAGMGTAAAEMGARANAAVAAAEMASSGGDLRPGMTGVTQQLGGSLLEGDDGLPNRGSARKLSELKAAPTGLDSDSEATEGAALDSVVPKDPAIARAARKLESFQGGAGKPKPVLRITSPAKQDVIFTPSANANDDAANTTVSVATVPVAYTLDGGAFVSLGPQVGGGSVSVCVTLDKATINGWKGGSGQTISRQAQLFFDATSTDTTRAVEESCFTEHSTLSLPNLGWGNYRLAVMLRYTLPEEAQAAATAAVPSWAQDSAGGSNGEVRTAVLFSVVEESATQLNPSYDWQRVEPWQTVPQGMEVTLPVGNDAADPSKGIKRARIPPRWQLQVYIEPKVGFLRVDVGPTTTLGSIRAAAARRARAEGLRLAIKASAAAAGGQDTVLPDWAKCGRTSTVDTELTGIEIPPQMFARAQAADGGVQSLTVGEVDLFGQRRAVGAVSKGCTEDPRVVRLRGPPKEQGAAGSAVDSHAITTFMTHFGLGGADVAGGWSEEQLRAALIGVIESQADDINDAADAAPL